MGRIHGQLLAKDERVRLIGLVDIERQRAEQLARELDTRAYDRLEDLLNENPTALYVATPNTRHVKPVLATLKAGVHVFSEKPMATSLTDAKQILEAAKSSRAIYQVGFNRRFAPVYKFAKTLIEEGTLTPYLMHIKINRGELKNPPWVSDTKMTGGFLYESTIHLLDMIRWLVGEVATVKCLAKSNVYQELDDFALLFEFHNGSLATLASCAHASWVFPFERVEIFGAHATVVTEEMERVIYSPGLGEEILVHDYSQLPLEEKWGYVEEDRLFVDAIVDGKPSPVPAEEGYRAVELVEACYSSSEDQ